LVGHITAKIVVVVCHKSIWECRCNETIRQHVYGILDHLLPIILFCLLS